MKGLGAICAAVLLVVAAAASVALACCGSDRALDLMRYYAAIGAVGVYYLFLLLFRDRLRNEYSFYIKEK